MDYKKSKAPVNTVTRNIMDLCDETDNIYESVAIIGKRANQISIELVADLLYCHIILLELCLDIVNQKVVEPFVSVSSAGLEHAGREVLRGYAKHLRIVFEDARLLVISPAKFDETVGAAA